MCVVVGVDAGASSMRMQRGMGLGECKGDTVYTGREVVFKNTRNFQVGSEQQQGGTA